MFDVDSLILEFIIMPVATDAKSSNHNAFPYFSAQRCSFKKYIKK